MWWWDSLNEKIKTAIKNTEQILDSYKHSNVSCSISGGSDSDCMLDMVERNKPRNMNLKYFFIDTGIEYAATKEHLNYLEDRYGIEINRVRSVKSIPVCCKEYGQPFINKYVSAQIFTLQLNNFMWEDKPIEKLLEEYPNCKGAVKWWCNDYGSDPSEKAHYIYNIAHNPSLKEFLIEYPPVFKISGMCCDYTKKVTAKQFNKENEIDLRLLGLRRAEGGVRSIAFESCYTPADGSEPDTFLPLFYFSDTDKAEYKSMFGIRYSDCYEVYGMVRTGCVGCPFAKDLNTVLGLSAQYEPALNRVCHHVFEDSYNYTNKYKEFASKRRSEYLSDRAIKIEAKKKAHSKHLKSTFWGGDR